MKLSLQAGSNDVNNLAWFFLVLTHP